MEVRGKIHKIMPVIDASKDPSKSFLKRELVLLYGDNPMYPNYVTFEFTQDRVSLLDSFHPGEEVEISFDLSGRPWTNQQGEEKYFTTLRAFMAKKVEVIAPPSNRSAPAQQPAAVGTGDEDDLPF